MAKVQKCSSSSEFSHKPDPFDPPTASPSRRPPSTQPFPAHQENATLSHLSYFSPSPRCSRSFVRYGIPGAARRPPPLLSPFPRPTAHVLVQAASGGPATCLQGVFGGGRGRVRADEVWYTAVRRRSERLAAISWCRCSGECVLPQATAGTFTSFTLSSSLPLTGGHHAVLCETILFRPGEAVPSSPHSPTWPASPSRRAASLLGPATGFLVWRILVIGR